MSMSRMRAEAEAAEKALEGMVVEPVEEVSEEKVVAEEEHKPEEAHQPKEEELGPDPIDALKEQLAAMEHRLSTVQGILKKSEAEKKSLQEKLTELSAVPAKKVEQPKFEDSDYFSDLKEEFGEKTAKAMISAVKAETSALQKENEELRDLLLKTGERTKAIETGFVKSAEDRYFESLGMKHPDWESINGNEDKGYTQDSRFTKFLSEKVPGTGKSYDALLQDAYDSLDVARTAEIFKIFKDRHPVVDTAKQKDVSHYVDPSVTGKGAKTPETKKQKRTYTPAEHHKLMMSLQTNSFRGTREEKIALQDELVDAELNGRVLY